MFEPHSRESIVLDVGPSQAYHEINNALELLGSLPQSDLALQFMVAQTISESIVALEQALPERLESYILTNKPILQIDIPRFVTKHSITEMQLHASVNFAALAPYARPLAQLMKTSPMKRPSSSSKPNPISKSAYTRYSSSQPQKKSDGILTNQILSSKINSKSQSPQPQSLLILNQKSLPSNQAFSSKPGIKQATSEFLPQKHHRYSNPAIEVKVINSIVTSEQSSKQHPPQKSTLNIPFQDPNFSDDETSDPRGNLAKVLPSISKPQQDDHPEPNFLQPISARNLHATSKQSAVPARPGRAITPTSVKQVKGKGASPTVPIQMKLSSKSPEVVKVVLEKKKWDVQVNQKTPKPQEKGKPLKLAEHYKQLLNESVKRQVVDYDEHSRYTQMAQLVPQVNQYNHSKSSAILYKKQGKPSKNNSTTQLGQNARLHQVKSQTHFSTNQPHQQSEYFVPKSTLFTEESDNQNLNFNELSYQEDEQVSSYKELHNFIAENQEQRFQVQKSEEVDLGIQEPNQNFREQFSFKPQLFEQHGQAQNFNTHQQEGTKVDYQYRIYQTSQGASAQPPQGKGPIQIKLNIEQFMKRTKPQGEVGQGSNRKSVSPIRNQQSKA